MLNFLFDAVALALLIRTFRNDDLAAEVAIPFAGAGAIAAVFVASLFVPQMGVWGYVAAGAIAGIGLACSLNLFVGLDIRKALAIGALFVALHAVIGIGLSATLEGRVHHRLILPLGPPPEREGKKLKLTAEEIRKLPPELRPFVEELDEE